MKSKAVTIYCRETVKVKIYRYFKAGTYYNDTYLSKMVHSVANNALKKTMTKLLP